MRDAPTLVGRLFSWMGALLFLASLGYFLFSYLVTFGIPQSGSLEVGAVTWNVALFTIFAMHHSVFARIGVRNWVMRTVPEYLERSVYVWVASIMFLLVCALWRPLPGTLWDLGNTAALPLWTLQIVGGWLTLKSAAILDVRELAGLTSAKERTDSKRTTEFRTVGPYGWVRHPIYAGWFLMVLPTPRMTMTRLVFATVSCAYLLLAIPLEEGTMRTGSNGAYDRYMQQVRWKLLPGLY